MTPVEIQRISTTIATASLKKQHPRARSRTRMTPTGMSHRFAPRMLTKETIAGSANPALNGSAGYVYDAVGNRLQRTSTIAGIPAQTFLFDSNDRLNTD